MSCSFVKSKSIIPPYGCFWSNSSGSKFQGPRFNVFSVNLNSYFSKNIYRKGFVEVKYVFEADYKFEQDSMFEDILDEF